MSLHAFKTRSARRGESCEYCGHQFTHLALGEDLADLVTETELGAVYCGQRCYREATGQELLEQFLRDLEE